MKLRIIFESELLDKPTLTPSEVAKKHNISVDMVLHQLSIGIREEMKEHTSNKILAREIALDHLLERPDYYSFLKNAERKDTQQKSV